MLKLYDKMKESLIDRFMGITAGKIEDLDDGHRKVLDIFSRHTFDRILDVGHGDGNFTILLKLASRAKEVYGVDCSVEAVKQANVKGIKSFRINVDSEKFPFGDNFFDGIFAGYIIEHLFNPDQLLDEVYRVLKPRGYFIVATPNLSSLYNRIALLLGFQPFSTAVSLKHNVGHMIKFQDDASYSDHIRVFTLRSLLELLKIHRFEIEQKIGVKIPTGAAQKMPSNIKFRRLIEFIDRIMANFSSLSYAVIVVCRKPYA